MKLTPTNQFAILLACIGVAVSALCFKSAAEVIDESKRWAIGYFAFGSLSSLLYPIGATIALRNNNPNIVFAAIGGPAAVALHGSLALVFKQPLSNTQWTAIAIIAVGTILLQIEYRQTDADEGSTARS